jgi:hypothetical protein
MIQISLHPHQHLFSIIFGLLRMVLTGMMRYLVVVLICISLTISDVDHLIVCLWSFEWRLWRNVFSLLLITPFHCFYWVFWIPYVVRILTSNWMCHLQVFSPILYFFFALCWSFPFLCRKFSDIVSFVYFCLCCLYFSTIYKNIYIYCQNQCQRISSFSF